MIKDHSNLRCLVLSHNCNTHNQVYGAIIRAVHTEISAAAEKVAVCCCRKSAAVEKVDTGG